MQLRFPSPAVGFSLGESCSWDRNKVSLLSPQREKSPGGRWVWGISSSRRGRVWGKVGLTQGRPAPELRATGTAGRETRMAAPTSSNDPASASSPLRLGKEVQKQAWTASQTRKHSPNTEILEMARKLPRELRTWDPVWPAEPLPVALQRPTVTAPCSHFYALVSLFEWLTLSSHCPEANS